MIKQSEGRTARKKINNSNSNSSNDIDGGENNNNDNNNNNRRMLRVGVDLYNFLGNFLRLLTLRRLFISPKNCARS